MNIIIFKTLSIKVLVDYVLVVMLVMFNINNLLLIHFNRAMKKNNLSENNKNEKLILGGILI